MFERTARSPYGSVAPGCPAPVVVRVYSYCCWLELLHIVRGMVRDLMLRLPTVASTGAGAAARPGPGIGPITDAGFHSTRRKLQREPVRVRADECSQQECPNGRRVSAIRDEAVGAAGGDQHEPKLPAANHRRTDSHEGAPVGRPRYAPPVEKADAPRTGEEFAGDGNECQQKPISDGRGVE